MHSNSVLLSLALDHHCVATEQVELVHLGLREGHNTVVVVVAVVHHETVRLRLLSENGCCGVSAAEREEMNMVVRNKVRTRNLERGKTSRKLASGAGENESCHKLVIGNLGFAGHL